MIAYSFAGANSKFTHYMSNDNYMYHNTKKTEIISIHVVNEGDIYSDDVALNEHLSKGGNPNALVSDVHILDTNCIIDYFGLQSMPFILIAVQMDTVHILLNYGATIEPTIGSIRVSPIFHAMRYPFKNTFKLLLDYGADINFKYKNITPLLFAVYYNADYDYIENIINNGGRVHCRYSNGETILHLAAKHDRIDLMEYFLKCNISIKSVDYKGNTPLHVATKEGNIKAVKFLLSNKAEINTKNYKGMTPIFYAFKKNRTDLIKYLFFEMKAGINYSNERHSFFNLTIY